MARSARLLASMVMAVSTAVFAAGGGGGGGGEGTGPKDSDPVIAAAKDAIAKQDWSTAQSGLKQALASSPSKADYHNLYAYSLRKGANPDMDLVFKHYNEALRLDPKHRGAHEYIGEAYLQVGDLAKAKEHLAALDKLCWLPCEEKSDLRKAVAAYEAKNKTQTSQR